MVEFASELDRHVPSSFGITSSFNYFITRILTPHILQEKMK